ncbi:DUF6718 family protein [Anaerotignum sp.]
MYFHIFTNVQQNKLFTDCIRFRPSAYKEYEPYHFTKTKEVFLELIEVL